MSDAVNKIEYHVVRAKTITHRLLGFARRMEPMAERVNINEILEESIEFLKNEARYRNIEHPGELCPGLAADHHATRPNCSRCFSISSTTASTPSAKMARSSSVPELITKNNEHFHRDQR